MSCCSKVEKSKGKLRYDLVPPDALEEVVKALGDGAKKHGDRDWEKGVPYSQYYAALMRHTQAWWQGQGKDKDSGLHHLAHAACCAMFLLSYELRGQGKATTQDIDDR